MSNKSRQKLFRYFKFIIFLLIIYHFFLDATAYFYFGFLLTSFLSPYFFYPYFDFFDFDFVSFYFYGSYSVFTVNFSMKF